jgi:hypothetical protein
MTTTDRAYRTRTIQGQTVCYDCITNAATSSEEAAALPARIVAEGRTEPDDCERLTPGCCIDHTAEANRNRAADSPCETW